MTSYRNQLTGIWDGSTLAKIRNFRPKYCYICEKIFCRAP